MASPVRVDGAHLLRKMEPDLPIAVGLKWDWSGIGVNASPCNLLIAQRLSVDYTLLRSSISEKRRSSCDTRARYCDALCAADDDAVLVHAELLVFGSVLRQLRRNCARASCASWCAGTRGLCAQQWFGWAMNVHGYRSSGAALCCGLIHQHRWAHPLPIVVTYALVVAEPCAWDGARRVARCTLV